MPKMSDNTLRALLAAQHSDALAATNANKLSQARSSALAYYNGDMSADMPAMEGRSSAVSMDVSDTVEGLLPPLMEIFCGSDEVVKFMPVGPEDVQAAEQESDYVNHVFMNLNSGFQELYNAIKDALLSKMGILKVWWETEDKEERETYYDKTPDEYALIANSPDVEIVEHTEQPNGLHDVTVVIKKTHAQARVMAVPPEEFGIERNARTIRDCNYCFHKVPRSVGELITLGYDAKQIKRLPTWRAWTDTEQINRDTVDENASASSEEINEFGREIEIVEHYIRMDYSGDGNFCLYKVTTGGGQGEILKLDGKPDIVEFDEIPFASLTPVPVPHRFFGKSIADLVMDIQRVKTALIRGALDNLYLHNNSRMEVAESHASESTLDDLMVSRPGGIVRTKQPGGLNPIQVQDITASIYPALEYMDQMREWRTGLSKQGQGIDSNALQNQSATAVAQVFSASQARVRLIARIFAETGIRDLFWLLHATIKKHGQQAAVVRLKNQWVQVDPRNWKTRNDLTIQVGLGTGSKAQQFAQLMAIVSLQEKALMAGKTNIVTDTNLYNAGKEATKLLSGPDVDTFFSDPAKMPPPQTPPDPAMVKAQADMQVQAQKAQLEAQKSQNDTQHQVAKTQAEMALQEKKFELEKQLKFIDAEIKAREHQMDMEKHQAELASKRIDTNMRLAESGKSLGEDGAVVLHATDLGDVKVHPALHNAMAEVVRPLADAMMASHEHLSKLITAKRKSTLHRDKKTGRAIGATHEIELMQ